MVCSHDGSTAPSSMVLKFRFFQKGKDRFKKMNCWLHGFSGKSQCILMMCSCRLWVEGAGRKHLCCFIWLEVQWDLQVSWKNLRHSPAVWWGWACSVDCKLLRDRQLFLQTQEGYIDTWRENHINGQFLDSFFIFCKYRGSFHYQHKRSQLRRREVLLPTGLQFNRGNLYSGKKEWTELQSIFFIWWEGFIVSFLPSSLSSIMW